MHAIATVARSLRNGQPCCEHLMARLESRQLSQVRTPFCKALMAIRCAERAASRMRDPCFGTMVLPDKVGAGRTAYRCRIAREGPRAQEFFGIEILSDKAGIFDLGI